MTIGKEQKTTYVETLLEQLSADERQNVLAKYADEETAISVVDENPANKLYGLNYQAYGLHAGDYQIVQEYFVNGYNKVQAYLSVFPDTKYTNALQLAARKFQQKNIWNFVNDILERMGISNAELERRIESFLQFDPLQYYTLKADKLGKDYWVFDLEQAKKDGVGRFIKAIKPGRYGLELQFQDTHKFYDLATKVRGMQKDVSIITDLRALAAERDIPEEKLHELTEKMKEALKHSLKEGTLPIQIVIEHDA